MTAPRYYTVAEAADVARLSPRYIRELVQRGDLPAARLGRVKGVRIPIAAFEEWLIQRAGGRNWWEKPVSPRSTSARTGDGRRK